MKNTLWLLLISTILPLSFMLMFLPSCGPEPHATQKVAEQKILEFMENTKQGYEPLETRLVDSIMVDSSTFEKLKHWDETDNLTRLLYNRRGILDLPVTDEDLGDDDWNKKRTIPAFYVYHHAYHYTENGRTFLNADIFSYSPLKHKIYREDFRPVRTITKEPAFMRR